MLVNRVSGGTLVVCFEAATSACCFGYPGHNGGGLIAVSFFGGYAASRVEQGALVLIAIYRRGKDLAGYC